MINAESLIDLLRYDQYASNLVLDVAAQLSDEQLDQSSSPSHNSVREMLQHMLGTGIFFLARSRGVEPTERPDQYRSVEEIRARWLALDQEIIDYLGSIDAVSINRVVEFSRADWSFPVWQLFVQVAMHSIHHRGELSIVLTSLGYPLPTLDIINYYKIINKEEKSP